MTKPPSRPSKRPSSSSCQLQVDWQSSDKVRTVAVGGIPFYLSKEAMLQNVGGEHHTCICVSSDLSGRGAKAFYSFNSVLDLYNFIFFSIEKKNRHLYECIDGWQPHCFYLDIDCPINRTNREKWQHHIESVVLPGIVNRINENFHGLKDGSTTLVYTSHGQEKLSYHILFPALVTSEPPMDIALYNMVTEGLDDHYCDRGVYRWWGQMRLLGSTKKTKVQRRRYKKIQGRDSSDNFSLEEFQQSLISSYKMPLLDWEAIPQRFHRKMCIANVTHRGPATKNPARYGLGIKYKFIMDRHKKFFQHIKETYNLEVGKNIQLRKNHSLTRTQFFIDRLKRYNCPVHRNKIHESENLRVKVVMAMRGTYYIIMCLREKNKPIIIFLKH